jgi:hypothetical protein
MKRLARYEGSKCIEDARENLRAQPEQLEAAARRLPQQLGRDQLLKNRVDFAPIEHRTRIDADKGGSAVSAVVAGFVIYIALGGR